MPTRILRVVDANSQMVIILDKLKRYSARSCEEENKALAAYCLCDVVYVFMCMIA